MGQFAKVRRIVGPTDDENPVGPTDRASTAHDSVGLGADEMGHPNRSYSGLLKTKTRLPLLLLVCSAESREKTPSSSRPAESHQRRIPSDFSGRNPDTHSADSKWPEHGHSDRSNRRTGGFKEISYVPGPSEGVKR
ncbi:hypothetical protein CRG98_025948 [Punica granatum]|uniref:Uncharacterized protein n=1 Tax=Punica granatum TaxID=22663 RepID=A0A2I0JBU6_PUNGR|nr:hypothetical protein CRG98_025948 [Punica granatum]